MRFGFFWAYLPTQKFIRTPWRTLLENMDSILLFFQLRCCLNTGNSFSRLTMDTTSANSTVLCAYRNCILILALCMFINAHSDCMHQCHAEVFCFVLFFLSYFTKKNNKIQKTYLRGREWNSSELWEQPTWDDQVGGRTADKAGGAKFRAHDETHLWKAEAT